MNLLMAFEEYEDIIWDRRKIIRQQLKEIIQLAQDLSIDDMQLRDMIYESCTRMGVSPSWLRKMLPENLKLTKHTRKDYLKRQLQRDQQPLQQTTTAATKRISRITNVVIILDIQQYNNGSNLQIMKKKQQQQ